MTSKIGRPTKLTPKLQETIIGFISRGNYLVTACQAVGISKTCYLDWLNRAELEADNGGGMYYDFYTAVKKAEAEAEDNILATVKEKATKEWLPAMTLLERRHPDRWGRKDRQTVTIDDHKTITITKVTVVKDYGETKALEGQYKELGNATKQEEE